MRVLLDNTPLAVDRPTLAAALSAGVAEAERTGRIVVEAMLDGTPFDPEMLTHPSDLPRTGGEVRFVSAEPRALVRTTLLDTADALAVARDDQQRAAQLVQTGELDEALALLGRIMTVWENVRQVVQLGSSLLNIDLDAAPPAIGTGPAQEAPPLHHRLAQLIAHLGEVKRTVEARDWPGLADALDFDLDADAQAWHDVLTGLAAAIAEGS